MARQDRVAQLMQMLDDARDADDDSYDTLLEDLTLRYPNIFNI